MCGPENEPEGEPVVKSLFSKAFYHIMNRMTVIDLVPGGTDYRMMTKQMADAVVSLGERERFTKGIIIVCVAAVYAIYTVVHVLMYPEQSTGRATIILIVLFIGGVIIAILGMIGEYLARIYMEVKQRPIYIVKESNLDADRLNRNNLRG